jgi:hypothetical protein
VASSIKGASEFPPKRYTNAIAQIHTDKIMMPQNTEYKTTKSENQAKNYKNRLNGWAIARLDSEQEKVIIARFRTRSDADGYMQHLRQVVPDATFQVIFDCQRETAAV